MQCQTPVLAVSGDFFGFEEIDAELEAIFCDSDDDRYIKKWLKKTFGSGSQSKPQQQQSYSQSQQQSYAQAGNTPYRPPNHQNTYGMPQQAQSYSGGYQQQPQYSQSQSPPHHQWSQAASEQSGGDVTALRNQAIQEGDLMKQCFDRAHQAHEAGDGAAAKQLSTEGHQHQANRDRLNRQAADVIYQEKNAHQPRGTIDLHGLYVQEAIAKTEDAISDAQRSGMQELRVIVGKGIHSKAHVQKIAPAIEDLMQKYGLAAELDPHNTGVLIVHLSGQRGTRDAGQLSRDLARQMPGAEDQCTIM